MERLLDEIEGATAHGTHEPGVGVGGAPGHDDRVDAGVGGLQVPEQIESVHTWHSDIDQGQIEGAWLGGGERLISPGNADDLVSGIEHPFDRAPLSRVVVDDENSRPSHGQAPPSAMARRRTITRVPRPTSLDIDRSPPTPTRMERHVGNPRPVPPSFVVTNGLSTCDSSSRGIPWPVSITSTHTSLSSARAAIFSRPPCGIA